MRKFRCRAIDCRWAVSGPDTAVRVFAFVVEGYRDPWFIVTSALDLSAAQVLEAYTARFRQEDAIRDQKQRLGMEEVRAWTIHAGDTAPKAAGVIHSDFERGFIKAETVAYDALIKCGSVAAAREKGLYRMEGKEYVVKDGDVMLFKFNV